MKKVTGIGVFSSNVKTQKQLTNGIKHTLGLTQAHMEQALNGGRLMTALKRDLPSGILLKENTKYFEPSTKDFMINYRVENLEALVEELRKRT
jgi:hypothetical protein